MQNGTSKPDTDLDLRLHDDITKMMTQAGDEGDCRLLILIWQFADGGRLHSTFELNFGVDRNG